MKGIEREQYLKIPSCDCTGCNHGRDGKGSLVGPAGTSVGKYYSVSLIKQLQDLDGVHSVGVKGLMRKYMDINLPQEGGREVEESSDEVHAMGGHRLCWSAGEGGGRGPGCVMGAGLCDGGPGRCTCCAVH